MWGKFICHLHRCRVEVQLSCNDIWREIALRLNALTLLDTAKKICHASIKADELLALRFFIDRRYRKRSFTVSATEEESIVARNNARTVRFYVSIHTHNV
jgi:hypothetical protein